MPIPPGTYIITGPILDTSGALLPASAELRDAGVISLSGGRVRKVNAAGDDWVDVASDGTTTTGDTLAVLAYDSTKTYIVGSIVTETVGLGSGLRFWIAVNATNASGNAPTRSVATSTTGWAILSELEASAWRREAPAAATYYREGDIVQLQSDSTIHICNDAGSYTAAQIPGSPNWAILAARDASVLMAPPVPTADAGFVGRFLFNAANDRLEICIDIKAVSTPPSGTWVDAPARTDFIIRQQYSDLGYSRATNDYGYVVDRGHFYQYREEAIPGGTLTEWKQSTPTLALAASRSVLTYAVEFLGERDTDADAILRITALAADTDYFFVNDERDLRRLDRASYTPPDAVTEHFVWQPTFDLAIAVGDMEELTEQPNLEDDVILFDRSTNSLKTVGIDNLGIFVKPDSSGHLLPATKEFVNAHVPAIVNGRVLEAYLELIGEHGAFGEWAEISLELIGGAWTIGDDYIAGEGVKHDGWDWIALVNHRAVAGTPPGTAANWRRVSPLGTEYIPDEWVDATEYVKYDRVRVEAGGGDAGVTFWRCLQDHISNGGTGDPREGANWTAYTLKSVDAGYHGVLLYPTELSFNMNGDWGYFTGGGIAVSERYNGTSWQHWSPPSIGKFLGNVADAENALAYAAGVYGVGDREYIPGTDGAIQVAIIFPDDVTGDEKLYLLVGLTGPVDGALVPGWREPDGLAEVRQIGIFWGDEQTESFPPTPVDRAVTARNWYRYKFNQEEPDRVIGVDPGVRALAAADVSNADLIPPTTGGTDGEASVGDHQVFRFPAGIYHLSFYASHNVRDSTTLGGWIYKINVGADDLELWYASGDAGSPTRPLTTPDTQESYGQIIAFERIFAFEDETDITLLAGDFGDVPAEAELAVDGAHFLTVERLE